MGASASPPVGVTLTSASPPMDRRQSVLPLTDHSGGGHTCSFPVGGWSVLTQGLVLSVLQSPFPFERDTLPVGKKRVGSQ